MEIQGIHGYEWANNLYHWIIYGHAWIVHDMHGSSLDLNWLFMLWICVDHVWIRMCRPRVPSINYSVHICGRLYVSIGICVNVHWYPCNMDIHGLPQFWHMDMLWYLLGIHGFLGTGIFEISTNRRWVGTLVMAEFAVISILTFFACMSGCRHLQGLPKVEQNFLALLARRRFFLDWPDAHISCHGQDAGDGRNEVVAV